MRNNKTRLILLILPSIAILSSYYFLFFVVKRSFNAEVPVRIFFDLYYPSMNIIILTFATLIFGLSVNFFGGKYRLSLFSILSGFVVLYAADFAFSYTTSIESFYTGGIMDILFMLAFYLIGMGTLSFNLTPKRQINTV